ncbi:MAG: PQQ-binding-like beta-propeller repeat protein [Gemmataceae bacterium]
MLRLVSAVITILSVVTGTFAGDWPRFLGPNGDGTTNEKGFAVTWPKAGPLEKGSVSLGIGFAPPTVAEGKLFHFDRFGDKNRLTCRDAGTLAELWKVEYPTDYVDQYGFDPGPRCCPVVDRGRVFIYGPEGLLACYATKDGKEIWTCDTQKQYHFQQNFFGVASTPFVEGDTLIVAVGGSPKGRAADFSQVQSNGTCLVGFDVATGKEKWHCGEDLASYASPVVVTMNGKRVGLYFARGGLLGFDPVAGKQLFRYPWRAKILESVNAANPVVFENKIFISESYQLGSACVSWDGKELKTVWNDREKDRTDKSMLAHWCTPILHEGHLYGCSSRHSPEADFRCVELATGTVKWAVTRTRWVTLIKVEDRLLILGETGQVRLAKPNPEKYEELAKFDADLSYPAWAPPVVSDGKLYVRGKEKLLVFDVAGKK